VTVLIPPRTLMSTRSSPVGRCPADATALHITAIIDADQLVESTRRFRVCCEYRVQSTDSWRTWAGFLWQGSRRAVQPSMGTACPPEGVEVRLKCWPLSTSITTGLRLVVT
jgi:hypothetical protein